MHCASQYASVGQYNTLYFAGLQNQKNSTGSEVLTSYIHGSVQFGRLETRESISFVDMKSLGERRILKQELYLWRAKESLKGPGLEC